MASVRIEARELAARMVAAGRTVDEVVAEIRHRFRCSPLAAHRLRQGLTQPEVVQRYLAEAGTDVSGMSQTLLSKLEQFPGKSARLPTAFQLITLAAVYETVPIRLLSPDALARLEPSELVVIRRISESRPATAVIEPPDSHPANADSHQLPSNTTSDADAAFSGAPLGRQVLMAARRAARFTAMAETQNVGPETIEQLRDDVTRLAAAYITEPLPSIVGEFVQLQDYAFGLLEGTQRPAQAQEIYLLAGVSSAFLAKASHDLGDRHSAMTQVRTAFVCADNAGHQVLGAWSRGLQSLISYWSGRYHEAIRYARSGLAVDQQSSGSTAIWLHALEARAWAALGDDREALKSAGWAAEVRERFEPDITDAIGGVMAFPLARQLYYSAGTNVFLGNRADHAEDDAIESLRLYRDAPPHEQSFSDIAGARTELAMARIHRQELDGVREAMAPVLDLAPSRRIGGIVESSMRIHRALNADQVRASTIARQTQEEIEEFCRMPVRVALPS